MDDIKEEYWRQRSRLRWTLQEDASTAYFHAIANGRRRKCLIPRLKTDTGEVSEQRLVMEHVYNFYGNLMGSQGETRMFPLHPELWPVEKRISDENDAICVTFTVEELDEYADNTMILIEPTTRGVANLKFILMCYENMSGLTINYNKSEAVVTGVSDSGKLRVANGLNCKLGSLPMHYLGLPVSNKALFVADWHFLTKKVGHRVDLWQGIFLAAAGRLELTNSCLSSLPMFATRLYLLHESTHGAMNHSRARSFWEWVGDKRKYHMVEWATVCRPRDHGGMGILNTKYMNIALMLRWIWKLYQNEEGLREDLLRAKYLGDNDLFSPEVPTSGSQFWRAIQKIKWFFKLGARH
ncbi:hypothetical protein QYE76_014799 [Lolium multiflorum]|uniref:Uncharacterized protein n=1 Tax=Lolium multiflorum TaxID=4521 RepID=A0AAD8X8I4_LOLMU|nr:hypothetical protein QYE76_014799 [Lolium multiflorum]